MNLLFHHKKISPFVFNRLQHGRPLNLAPRQLLFLFALKLISKFTDQYRSHFIVYDVLNSLLCGCHTWDMKTILEFANDHAKLSAWKWRDVLYLNEPGVFVLVRQDGSNRQVRFLLARHKGSETNLCRITIIIMFW
jgi:hypothetical protein